MPKTSAPRILVFILSIAAGFAGVITVSSSLFYDGPDLLRRGPPPDVFLIVIESTRADHIGPCYGYNRTTAPNICSLAKDGVLFENAYAQGTATHFAMPVLLTSKPPNAVSLPREGMRLSDNVTTIGEILRGKGYTVMMHERADSWQERGIKSIRVLNLDQGLPIKTPVWNIDQLPEGPVFSMTFLRRVAHFPYVPEKRFRNWTDITGLKQMKQLSYAVMLDEDIFNSSQRSEFIGLYDGEIRQADAKVGAIIDRLKRAGRYREAMIIITSDHGEKFGGNLFSNLSDYGHGGRPEMGTVHVPLIIKFPGNRFAGTRVSSIARHMDVVPTVMDVIGAVPGSAPFIGKSLIPLIKEGGSRTAFAVGGTRKNWASWNRTRFLLIGSPREACVPGSGISGRAYPIQHGRILADQDPDLMPKGAPLYRFLCNMFRSGSRMEQFAPKTINLTVQQRRRLEKLGYLDDE